MSDDFIAVETSDLRLVFWPGCGGRLISASTRGIEFLWRNPEFLSDGGELRKPRDAWQPLDGTIGSWANVGGSKTWPAPQGWSGLNEWPGPPDGILDSGTWSCTKQSEHGGHTVVMTSPADHRTGLTIERRFDIPATGQLFQQTNRFTNCSSEPVSWSIWEVCQVATADAYGGVLRVGVDDETPPIKLLTVLGSPDLGSLVGNERHLPVQTVVGKLGFPTANRLIGLDRPDGARVEICFEAEPGAPYPDGGSRAELWRQYPIPAPLPEVGGLHPQAHLVELEVLGPLVTLLPGQQSEMRLGWGLRGPSSRSRPGHLSGRNVPG